MAKKFNIHEWQAKQKQKDLNLNEGVLGPKIAMLLPDSYGIEDFAKDVGSVIEVEYDKHNIKAFMEGLDEYFSIYSDDEKSIDNEKPEGFPFGEDPLDDFPKIREQNVTGTGASFNAGDGAGYATPNAFADNEDDWKNKNSKYTE